MLQESQPLRVPLRYGNASRFPYTKAVTRPTITRHHHELLSHCRTGFGDVADDDEAVTIVLGGCVRH